MHRTIRMAVTRPYLSIAFCRVPSVVCRTFETKFRNSRNGAVVSEIVAGRFPVYLIAEARYKHCFVRIALDLGVGARFVC